MEIEAKSFKGWLKHFIANGKVKPDIRITSTAGISDKYSEYPSNGLTPEKLSRIFRAADDGDVLSQMELFEEMEEKDPHLFSQLQTRKNAVTGLDFEISACSDSEVDKAVANFVEETLNGIEGFNEALFDLLDAIGKGISISEILWGYKGDKVIVRNLKCCHQKRLLWDHEDTLRIRTKDNPAGIRILENKFIIHKYKARSGHAARAGVLRVVSWMYLFKNYTVKDWVRFCELFGMPLRIGKYNPGASEEEKMALMQALVQLGTDAAGILPEGTSIEFNESQKTTSINLYETLARYCDEQISKAVLGQTLTSDSGSSGSFAQSKTHNEVRHDLTSADCKALASTLKRDLIKPLVRYNFGNVGIPTIRFDCKEAEDLKAESEILDNLVNKIGLKISSSYAYKKFNIPQPEDGDELLGAVSKEERGPLGLGLKALKEDIPVQKQEQIDKIVEKSVEMGVPLFQKIFAPIMDLVNGSESLEELAENLKDKDFIIKIFEQMDVPDFEELLQRAMMAADLTGRVIENEG